MAHTPTSGAVTLASHNGIDVAQAEADFAHLQNTLSGSNRTSREASTEKDPEKGWKDSESEEGFDLREYLSSSNDANQQAGIKHKHVGVTWEDLEVKGFGGGNNKVYVPTFFDAIIGGFMAPVTIPWGIISGLLPRKDLTAGTRTIIYKNSGILKPGEMCLVLGRPGSGCTSFLKAIANERGSYAAVTGDVKYAGISHEEMAKHYKGEVLYNQEDDTHIPTLSVNQTIDFALAIKAPGPQGRLPGVSKKDFNLQVRDLLLRMLNISHTSQNMVGDEMVPGVSGGERKRVSIAEMMATRARVQSWDNSTRGLDASTALDLVKGLRVMTDVLGQTTFVSLYQAGESIYELFDKVLVIDEGRQVYYGPASEARAHFESIGYKAMPRQTTADYLTGCTDPNQRQFAPGRSVQDVPSTPEALERAYLDSRVHVEVEKSLVEYKVHQEVEKSDQEAFRAAVLADKKKGVSKKSPHTLGFTGQVWALTVRQFQTRLQNKFELITSYCTSMVLALVIGGAYFNLSTSAGDGFTRGSLIFTSTLVTVLDAFGEIPLMVMGRPILWKQTSYSMYHPAALPLANTLSDIPFSFGRIFSFNIIFYFMVNFARNGGGFWTFAALRYTGFLALQALFRTFGMLTADFDVAFRLSVFVMPPIVHYSGYMLPEQLMKKWLFWIYYINPFSYAWGGIMENEFSRISLTCDGDFVVPRNPPGLDKYPATIGPNQACTLFGATPGSPTVSGRDYLSAGYNLDTNDIWRRDFIVLVGMFIFYQLAQLVAITYFQGGAGGGGVAVFAKEDAETKKLDSALQIAKSTRKTSSDNLMGEKQEKNGSSNHVGVAARKTFTWEKVNYTVPVPGGTRQLLQDVSGFVKPGTMTALMGSSGAGKTTCLDVLAQRKNIGVVTGDLLLDGRPLSSDFARGTAYAEQMDVHEVTATVREALRFSAYLRQPFHISKEEKDSYVEEVIDLLELHDLANAVVASLGLEARKRLTIGVELASKPEVLLFLDEPTSGLDAQSAWNIVRFLRKLANNGQAILCTIHQPSAFLFESFDRLLLLQRGGETIYFGDVGEDAEIIREYLARHGAHCPPNANPAEYMLEAIGAGLSRRIGDRDWADIWNESPEHQDVLSEIQRIKTVALAKPVEEHQNKSRYSTPLMYQLKVVSHRAIVALWRNPGYVYTRLFFHAIVSLMISLCYLRVGNSVRDLQSRVFAIFWVTIVPLIIMSQLQPLWLWNRRTFVREAHSRIYAPEVFAFSQLVSEIPFSVICAVTYWVLMVYPIGFGQGTAGLNGTGFDLLVIFFVELFGVTLGQALAAVSPGMHIVVLFNPFIVIVLTNFCGVTIPYPQLGEWARSWLYWLDPYGRILGAMLPNELYGLKVTCKPNEFTVFHPPSGQTCGAWANDFVQGLGGYLDNANDTSDCRYCQYAVGDEFYEPLHLSYSDRWRDCFIILVFVAFNFIVVVLACKFMRYARR